MGGAAADPSGACSTCLTLVRVLDDMMCDDGVLDFAVGGCGRPVFGCACGGRRGGLSRTVFFIYLHASVSLCVETCSMNAPAWWVCFETWGPVTLYTTRVQHVMWTRGDGNQIVYRKFCRGYSRSWVSLRTCLLEQHAHARRVLTPSKMGRGSGRRDTRWHLAMMDCLAH